ncbi:putative epoxide hydrolase [Roseibacterium elongatum DSM 19469]|uniref:Putative epoxide hydrolase n=1 Tax=Roseicyclus elongatus DSM 19469 TaxID=1294273 RepID=W8RQ80_9RHOB|nr:alpha/beta hydrolase [Roseibacterium elongatum]AHM03223.1 putative epoxide hydrolase [Roseibacterium elongatum DSM 19469]
MPIDGFTQSRIETNGIGLSVHQAGQGAPLILLHGYPQNHMCWENLAPRLARDFHVIIPDLRGYGDSDAPPADPENRAYSKREMARDIAGLMDALGLEKAHVLGHDRGARVTYRLALDHPNRVDRIGIIEIVPTGDFWAAWSADLALKAYHWTFLAQPSPLPERMILSDGPGYIDWTLASWTHAGDLSPFSEAALSGYRAQAADPARVAAMCSDYRAGATVDRALDEADRAAGRTIAAPLHFVWSEHGFPARTGDPLGVWRGWAPQVTGQEIAGSGHFAMEEVPDAVLAALLPHFGSRG